MKRFLSCLVVAALTVPVFGAAEDDPKTEPIFNGKDLAGWKVPKDNIWFTVNDGVLLVKSDPKKKGQTLWTEKKYRNFIVECEFKMGEGFVDSGIFIRNSNQIQIGISGSLKRDMTASPYIPGKKYPVEALTGEKAKLLKPKDWNHIRIKAVGPKYTSWLNGTKVMEYESPTAIDEGPIGIQLHPGREMSIEYRDIRLAELP